MTTQVRKIACIGNLNHAQFIIARYLRDMGHEVTLFLLEEQDNFYPQNDAYGEIENIRIVELPWKHKRIYEVKSAEIQEKLGGFDYYFGSEYAPAFLYKGKLPLDVYIPIGTDLIQYPFHKPKGFIPETWAIQEQQFHMFQRWGIRHAGAIFMNLNGDENLEKALKKIKFRGRRYNKSLPYLYLPEFSSAAAKSPLEESMREWRRKYGTLFISHGRCEYLSPDSVHHKGTEVLLQGFAQAIQNGLQNAGLVMLEYGNDWAAAKEWTRTLGIEEKVHWLPKAGRKDIFPLFQYCDAAIGTLHYPHWSYNVAMEAIAAGLPLIQKGPEDVEKQTEIYPYFAVHNVSEMAQTMQTIARDTKAAKQKGEQAKMWFEQHMVNPALEDLKAYLQSRHSQFQRSLTEVIQWWWWRALAAIGAGDFIRYSCLNGRKKV